MLGSDKFFGHQLVIVINLGSSDYLVLDFYVYYQELVLIGKNLLKNLKLDI